MTNATFTITPVPSFRSEAIASRHSLCAATSPASPVPPLVLGCAVSLSISSGNAVVAHAVEAPLPMSPISRVTAHSRSVNFTTKLR